jgi:hypothetical protein
MSKQGFSLPQDRARDAVTGVQGEILQAGDGEECGLRRCR